MEAERWSPVPQNRIKGVAAAAGGSGADGSAAAAAPAAATSRSSAPSGLSPQATPVEAAQQQLAAAVAIGQVAERVAAKRGGVALDGYTQASASAGAARREAVKASDRWHLGAATWR